MLRLKANSSSRDMASSSAMSMGMCLMERLVNFFAEHQ
ncbi:hypothetical protein LINPERHAP1_LOCUS7238 [Linum perenne]